MDRRAFMRGMFSLGSASLFPQTAFAAEIPLEDAIQRYIDGCRDKGIPETDMKMRPQGTENISILIYDIEKATHLVRLNADDLLWAASMNKTYVLLGYYHQVHRGRIKEEKAYTGSGGYLEQMIRWSINDATNQVIAQVGGAAFATKIAQFYGFQKTEIATIPMGGRTTENLTCAEDLDSFFRKLYDKQFPFADEISYFLDLPNKDRVYDNTCIPKRLDVDGDGQCEITAFGIIDKTGSMYGLCGETALLNVRYTDKEGVAREKPYTFTVIIEDKTIKQDTKEEGYHEWLASRTEVIHTISEAAYWRVVQDITGIAYKCTDHNGNHLV